jgi:hypothetical protein
VQSDELPWIADGRRYNSCLRQLPDRQLRVPPSGPFRAVGRRTSQPKAFGRQAAALRYLRSPFPLNFLFLPYKSMYRSTFVDILQYLWISYYIVSTFLRIFSSSVSARDVHVHVCIRQMSWLMSHLLYITISYIYSSTYITSFIVTFCLYEANG